MTLAATAPSTANRTTDALREKGVFIALGTYTAASGAGWLALAASFM